MNLADSKKFCDINTSVNNNSGGAANVSLLYDKFKSAAAAAAAQAEGNTMDYLKHSSSGNNNGDALNATNNNNTITNNNTSIKSERLSPTHQPATHQQSQAAQHNGGNGDAQSSHSRWVHFELGANYLSVSAEKKKRNTPDGDPR